MAKLGIALDLGTSGFRGQAIDLEQKGRILSTAITTRHPLPGANVIDHLHFALEVGLANAHEVMIGAANQVIASLRIDPADIVKLAVCGNPIQLSLFQEIEIRDLAYAGKRKLKALGVIAPKRDAQIVMANDIRGLEIPSNASVLIPPAVQHEIGADALAIMTEWSQFRTPNLVELQERMAHPIVFDGRNLYDPETMANAGFTYHSIGRPTVRP